MTSQLVDLAAPPGLGLRSLTLVESDRARLGSSIAVLVADPGGMSPHWPQAVAAYRRVWADYKAASQVAAIKSLLAAAAAELAQSGERGADPGLVAGFVTVDGAELSAWILATAALVVRRGDELLELGPHGFAAVPAGGTLRRGFEAGGLWTGGLGVGAGTRFCLLPRAAGQRLGLWRLEAALAAPTSAAALREFGVLEEPVVTGRVVRAPEVAMQRLGEPLAPKLPIAAPPVAELPAAVYAEPVPPLPSPAPLEVPMRDAGGQSDLGAPAGPRPAGESREAAGELVPPPADDQEIRELLVRASRRADRRTSGPGRETPAPPLVPPTPAPEGMGPAQDILLLGRRHRGREGAPGWIPLGNTIDISPGPGFADETRAAAPDRLLVRRGLFWGAIGAALVIGLALVVGFGRLLTGGRPAGPDLSHLDPTAPAATSAITGSAPPAPAVPPPGFTGASWTRRFSEPITSSPLLLGDRLVVGGRDGNLYALAVADGHELWRLELKSGIGSSPTWAGELAVVGTYGGEVVAADLATGAERWRMRAGGRVVSSPVYVPGKGRGGGGGIVAVGSFDHRIYGIEAETGAVKWKAATGGIVWASPIAIDDRIVVGSFDAHLYCLDASTGRLLWKAAASGPISSTAVRVGSGLVVGTGDGQITAFRLADGQRVWSERAGAPVNGPLTLAGDLVLAGTDGGDLVALKAADGSRVYRVATGGAIKARPAVVDKRIWFTSYDGKLRVADLETGRILWTFPARGRLFSSPAILGRTAFFGSMDGIFYAATWPNGNGGGG